MRHLFLLGKPFTACRQLGGKATLKIMTNNDTLDIKKMSTARSAFSNQGTSTPESTRTELGLHGLLPPKIESYENQKKRVLRQLSCKTTDLEKYQFLAFLRNTNIHLFFSIAMEEFELIAPLIYTPTVGEACKEYSNIYPFLAPPLTPDGLFISLRDRNRLEVVVENYLNRMPNRWEFPPQIAVVTDGSRILGLGDLGVNGMGIPVGKLQLYVIAAGLDPKRTLPIHIDFGTNNEEFLREDTLYLGLPRMRNQVSEKEYLAFWEAVLDCLTKMCPGMLVQFEDIATDYAVKLLRMYKKKYLCFNDDIQGTGAVILAGFINAIRQVDDDAGKEVDQRVLFVGAGSAAIGVARQLMEYFIRVKHMSEARAKRLFWMVDSKGLITLDRGDRLAEHKVYFARDDNNGRQYKKLTDIIEYVQPTCLIGLSTVHGIFTPEAIKRMGELNRRPIIFPLSNPDDKAECDFETAMKYTGNRVIFASGTGFPPYTDPQSGRIYHPNQGNNMYVFPGLGLGSHLAKPTYINDNMIYAAADSLSRSLSEDECKEGLLYPRLYRIRHVSAEIAVAVNWQAYCDGLAGNAELLAICKGAKQQPYDDLMKFVRKQMWVPSYYYNEQHNIAGISARM